MHQEIIDIAKKIGRYYLQKNDNDYEKTEEEIALSRFQSLEIKDNILFIKTSRPGRVIGKRGQNIDDLTQYLGMKTKIIETEDIGDIMTPVNYEDELANYEDELFYNDYHQENYDIPTNELTCEIYEE